MITTKKERIITAIIAAFAYLFLYYAFFLIDVYKLPSPAAGGFALILAPLCLFPIILMAHVPNITKVKYYSVLALTVLGAFSILFLILAILAALYYCLGLRAKKIKPVGDADIPGRYFQVAENEITDKKTIAGLYAKSRAMADGDPSRGKSLYVRARARELYELEHTSAEVEKLQHDVLYLKTNWNWWRVGKMIFFSIMVLFFVSSIFLRNSIWDFAQWIVDWNIFVFKWLMGTLKNPPSGKDG